MVVLHVTRVDTQNVDKILQFPQKKQSQMGLLFYLELVNTYNIFYKKLIITKLDTNKLKVYSPTQTHILPLINYKYKKTF